MTSWHDDLKTKIIKSDLLVYKTAFGELCQMVAKQSGTTAETVESFWLRKAGDSLVTDVTGLYVRPL